MDQAGTLRRLMSNRVAIRPMNMRPVRVISVTSGKGGVGKTNIVANLAVQLQKAGHQVLVLDGDFGLANLNIVMGLDARHTIDDVVSGEKDIADIMLTGPHGVKVIPASSGIFRMTQLSMADKTILMERLEAAPLAFDTLLIDTGAGINSDVAYLNALGSLPQHPDRIPGTRARRPARQPGGDLAQGALRGLARQPGHALSRGDRQDAARDAGQERAYRQRPVFLENSFE
ncbi:MAG: AAA family ATPase [Deltaproteobacteria bacterium]|nr:AAA family ATPase [Deltaproteobacteria bacterium]